MSHSRRKHKKNNKTKAKQKRKNKNPIKPGISKDFTANRLPLSKLNYYSHYQITGISPLYHNAKNNFDTKLLHFIHAQYEDQLSACLYSEEKIIPKLLNPKTFARLSSAHLKQWFFGLQQRVCKSVAIESDQHELLGSYVKYQTVSWHHSAEIGEILKQFYIGDITRKSFDDRLAEFGVKSEQGISYINLIRKYSWKDSIELPSNVRYMASMCSNKKIKRFFVAQNRIIAGYHQGLLSERDLEIVNSLLQISIPPNKIESQMNKFFENLVNKWKRLSKTDDAKIAELCADVYKKITGEMHPSFNLNEVLAEHFINLILISMQKKPLQIAMQAERRNSQSLFNMAYICRVEDPQQITEYIKLKINLFNTDFEDAKIVAQNLDVDRDLVIARAELVELLDEIKEHYLLQGDLDFDIDSFYHDLEERSLSFASTMTQGFDRRFSPEQISLYTMWYGTDMCKKKIESMRSNLSGQSLFKADKKNQQELEEIRSFSIFD